MLQVLWYFDLHNLIQLKRSNGIIVSYCKNLEYVDDIFYLLQFYKTDAKMYFLIMKIVYMNNYILKNLSSSTLTQTILHRYSMWYEI